MIKLCKMQFCFVFSKAILIITSFILLCSGFICFMLTETSIGSNAQDEEMYLSVIFNIVRILFTIVAIVISSYSFISSSDQYSVLVLNSKNTKTKIFTSKIVVILLYLLITLIVESIIIGTIGYIRFDYLAHIFFKYVLQTGILLIYYSLLSVLLILLFDYFYVYILPISIFLMMEVVDENNLLYIFIKYEDGFFALQDYYYLFLSFILLIICIFVYRNKNRT